MVESRRVYIRSASAVAPTQLSGARQPLTQDPDTDLGALTKQIVGQRLRQASHFIELASIGARLCLGRVGRPVPSDTAVYVGTGLGELRKNESLFRQVFPPGVGTAAPFDFINATANMAAFYVARMMSASARNLTVNRGLASFETVLRLAYDDIRAGAVRTALVGGVDENCFPRSLYAHRWPLRDDEIMGEGSAWLLLSDDSSDAIAELFVATVDRSGCADLASAIGAVTEKADWIVRGSQLSAADVETMAKIFPRAQFVSYIDYCGQYPTAAGFGVASQLEGTPAPGSWLHVNRDSDGSVMFIGWRV